MANFIFNQCIVYVYLFPNIDCLSAESHTHKFKIALNTIYLLKGEYRNKAKENMLEKLIVTIGNPLSVNRV